MLFCHFNPVDRFFRIIPLWIFGIFSLSPHIYKIMNILLWTNNKNKIMARCTFCLFFFVKISWVVYMVRYNTRHYTKTFFYKQLFQMDEFFFSQTQIKCANYFGWFFFIAKQIQISLFAWHCEANRIANKNDNCNGSNINWFECHCNNNIANNDEKHMFSTEKIFNLNLNVIFG